MTLLTTIQSACSLLGLVQPTAVVASTDRQVQQLYQLANEEGQELLRRFNWRRLTKQHTFLTTAAAVQVGGLADDWDHFIDQTMFNRDQRRRVEGPITEEQWQVIQSMNAATPITPAYRLRGVDFLLTPTPAAGETIAYEYISTLWVLAADGTTYRSYYEADNDTALLHERLIALGIRWRFQQAKGLDYAESMRTYGIEVQKAAGRDKGMPTISSGGVGQYWPPYPNIPDGNWPG
jgi:hypothetical protein